MQNLLEPPFEDLMEGQPVPCTPGIPRGGQGQAPSCYVRIKKKSNNNNNGHSVTSITDFLQQSEC